MGSQRVGHDQVTKLSFFLAYTERGTQVLLRSCGLRSLPSPLYLGLHYWSSLSPRFKCTRGCQGSECSVASMEMKGFSFKPWVVSDPQKVLMLTHQCADTSQGAWFLHSDHFTFSEQTPERVSCFIGSAFVYHVLKYWAQNHFHNGTY